jgi:hypothetical protein
MDSAPSLCVMCRHTLGDIQNVLPRLRNGPDNFFQVPYCFEGKSSYPYPRDRSSLQRTAAEGCYICIRLWRKFNQTPQWKEAKQVKLKCALEANMDSKHIPNHMNIHFVAPLEEFDYFWVKFNAMETNSELLK